jgi:hypothetical protein
MLSDDDDADILPFFPDPELAQAFKEASGFDEFDVIELDVNELLEWLDDMESEETLVAVFPNTAFNGAVLPPEMVLSDLRKELEKYDEDGKKIIN